MLAVETVADESEVSVSVIVGMGQQMAFSFKVGTHGVLRYFVTLHGTVEVDDVGISIANNMCTAHGRIEANNTRAKERLNPATIEADTRGEDEVVNPRHEFGLDAL